MVTLDKKILEWCAENVAAAHFCLQAWDAAQRWDDAHDTGKNDNAVLAWLAFGKETDPFFKDHADLLRPVLMSVYLDWQAANTMEAAPTVDRMNKSYMLRAGIYRLFLVCAYLCGGHDHAVSVAADVYDFYGETLGGHQAEFMDGRAA